MGGRRIYPIKLFFYVQCKQSIVAKIPAIDPSIVRAHGKIIGSDVVT